MKKHHPMFLLEILIAMSLVTLCITPLIKGPMDMHRAEMGHLKRIEQSRIAAWTFTEIAEKLLKNELRWEQIPKLQEAGPKIVLSDVQLKLPPLPKKSIVTRKYTIKTLQEKQETNGRIHRLLAIKLKVGDRKFTYRVTVTKLPTAPSL